MRPEANKGRSDEERLTRIERDMDRKLTFLEHMHAQIVEIEAYGDDTDIDIRLDPQRIKSRPYGVLCVEVRNLDNPESPGSLGGSVPWCYRAPTSGVGYARILNFPGLDAATRYLVRFLILGG